MINSLKKDWKTKILAVCIAVIFWIYVYNVTNPIDNKTIYSVPIEFINKGYLDENGFNLKSMDRSSVDIIVRGRHDALEKVTANDFDISLDYSQVKSVDDRKLAFSEPVCNKKDVSIVSYSPKVIDVQLTRNKLMNFAVELKSNIAMKPGYVLLGKSISPDSLPIVNEESLVDSIGSVVANLEIKDLDRDLSREIQCTVYNKEGKEMKNLSVNLNVTVKLEVAKEVPVSLMTRGRLAADYVETLRVIEPVKALITGPADTLADISEIKTEPVNIDKISGNFSDSVPLIVPEGVKLVNTPKNITVNINVEKLVLRDIEILNEDVSILNAKNDGTLAYEIKTDKLMLQFKGRQADVDAIKLENLKPSVDVAGLAEGAHKLPLIITSPSQAKLQQQAYVEVKISKTPETPPAQTTEQ